MIMIVPNGKKSYIKKKLNQEYYNTKISQSEYIYTQNSKKFYKILLANTKSTDIIQNKQKMHNRPNTDNKNTYTKMQRHINTNNNIKHR